MIRETLKSRLTDSIKAHEMERVALLRLLLAAINNKEIELRIQKIEMLDKHILKTIQKEIKQRNDSIESYKSGNRQDLVEKETSELKMLEEIFTEFSPHEEQ